MIVAGVMSGTSADGINVALVQVSARGREPTVSLPKGGPRHTLLGHSEYPFPAPVRRAILGFMNAELARVADLARLNFLLGELYAEAVAKTARKHRVKVDLVGCHGQTLYHQGAAARFLGRKLAVTWQTGEGAVIAARLGVPVVSDFRPADMAAGGKGALIGSGIGAAAGTTTAFVTGRKDVGFSAERRLRFRLNHEVSLAG